MADLLDSCPQVVKSNNEFTKTLVASVPYGYEDSSEVEVPPIADKDDPFVQSVRSNASLTPQNGTRPLGAKDMVGWEGGQAGSAEYSERSRLRQMFNQMRTHVQNSDAAMGPIHPQAKYLVRKLAVEGVNRLNEIRALYEKWRNRSVPSSVGGDQPLGLDVAIWQLAHFHPGGVWGGRAVPEGTVVGIMAPLTTPQEVWQVASYNLWGQNAIQMLGEGGYVGPVPGTLTVWDLANALVAEQSKDRKAIRELYRRAYKLAWCAEYGVAQSQSYYTNKFRFDSGPGGQVGGIGGFATPPPPPPGIPQAMDFGANLPPGPDPLEPPPTQPSDDPCVRAQQLTQARNYFMATGQQAMAAQIVPQLAAAQVQCATVGMGPPQGPSLGQPPAEPSDADEEPIPPLPPLPGEDASLGPDADTGIDAGGVVDGGDVAAQPWYQTTPGKIGIGVGVVGVASLAAWGISSLLSGPRSYSY